jgi:hypothetical protein
MNKKKIKILDEVDNTDTPMDDVETTTQIV